MLCLPAVALKFRSPSQSWESWAVRFGFFRPSQDIFEETPDKDRFVGDVMFWKFFEDIDANRIYHTNSVEYRTVSSLPRALTSMQAVGIVGRVDIVGIDGNTWQYRTCNDSHPAEEFEGHVLRNALLLGVVASCLNITRSLVHQVGTVLVSTWSLHGSADLNLSLFSWTLGFVFQDLLSDHLSHFPPHCTSGDLSQPMLITCNRRTRGISCHLAHATVE